VVKNLMFFAPEIFGGGPVKCLGAFINQHHFQPTGAVLLRSHGRSDRCGQVPRSL